MVSLHYLWPHCWDSWQGKNKLVSLIWSNYFILFNFFDGMEQLYICMLVLTDLVSLICLFDFWLHACRLFWRDPKLFPAFLSFWNWFMYILMHIPSQTESPLFLATKAVRGLLCPSLLLLLRSLSRVPRAQKPWIRPWRRYVISISIFYLFIYFFLKSITSNAMLI